VTADGRPALAERRQAYIAGKRETAEAKMRSYLPPGGADGNGS
jgi:hypothetical protein